MIQDEWLMEPILMTSVLSKFIFNPHILEYSTKVFTSSVNDFAEWMKICVSFAYCLIWNYFLPIFIPSIFVLFLIPCAKISAHRISIYGESGHPWRTPRSKENYSELNPLLVTELLMSMQSIWTHCFIRGGKLNFSRHWYINGHSKVSNAFSKSTDITSAGIFLSCVKYIKSMIVVIFWPIYRPFRKPVWW